MLQQIEALWIQRPFVHPDEIRVEAGANLGGTAREHVAAADVDLVVERQRHRHRRERLVEIPIPRDDAVDAARAVCRPYRDQVTDTDHAGSDLTGIATEIIRRTNHQLDGEPEWTRRGIAFDLDGLEIL